MDKDKFDKGLREKLGNTQIIPPSDMWERIAATLKEQGLTVAEQATEAPAPISSYIRHRRWLRAGYAAAAAILIGAIIFGISRMEPDKTLIAEETGMEQQIIASVQEIVEREQTVNEREEPRTPPVQRYAAHEIQAPSVRAAEVNREDIEVKITTVAETEPVAETKVISETVASANKSAVQTSTGETRRQWTDRDEIERMLNNNDRKKRKADPVNIGLYSANTGDQSSEKTVQSTPYANVTSDFLVNEFSNESYDNAPVATQSATKLEHKVPIMVGISVTKGITGRLSLESGATYTYLLSRGEKPSNNGGTYNIKRELHYVGIPIGIKYDMLQGRRIDLYTSVSGLFEMCVSSRKKLSMKNGDVSGDPKSESLNVRGIQPSVAAYVGAEIKLTKNMGLYVEPGLSYYFDVDQPESYRTENPLNFSLRTGLRISLR